MHVAIERLHFTHRRGGAHAVRGVSLEVRPGDVLGLLGPNGAGKSTLLSCLLGFLRPREGRVLIDGRPPDDLGVRSRLGWLSESPSFSPGLSAREVLELDLALLRVPVEARREAADAALDAVGLREWAGHAPATFSHGMRQRLGIARAWLGDPRLFVLDEPATGLDPAGVAMLREKVRSARERGAAVIVSSHQLDEVERTCDRILFMREGALVAEEEMALAGLRHRVLRVRLRTSSGALPAEAELERLGAAGGARLLGVERDVARFEVRDDEHAALLARAVVGAGLDLLEVQPEQSRLESLFVEVTRS